MIAQTKEMAIQVHPWIIRRANADDDLRLLAYFEEIADERPNNTVIRRSLQTLTPAAVRERIQRYEGDNRSAMFVAICADAVVGYVSMTSGTDPFSQHVVSLSINVGADWRGRGLGSALLRAALSWARSQPHVNRVELEALTRNAAAIRLYQRHGFRLEGIHRRAYQMIDEGDGQQMVDAAHMALIIPRDEPLRPRAEEFSAWDDEWLFE